MNKFLQIGLKAVFAARRDDRPRKPGLVVLVALVGASALGLLAYFLVLALGENVEKWRHIISVLVFLVWFFYRLMCGDPGSSRRADT